MGTESLLARYYPAALCALTQASQITVFDNAMNIQQAYTDWSATYDQDRNLTRDLDEIVTREMLANLRSNSTLEIGCGTGKNTELLAQISQYVSAVDFSLSMLEKASEKLSSDNIKLIVADISHPWPWADDSFDLIVCNLLLEHIADLSFVFAEAARVLGQGGRFFVSELHPFRQYQGTQARFQRQNQTTEIPAFVHHVTDFLSTAEANQLSLTGMKEWWHPEDQNKPPRLVSFMFQKR